MTKYIAAAPANGFTLEQLTQGQLYPAAEVAQYLPTASADTALVFTPRNGATDKGNIRKIIHS
jgi:hypothetical protein